MRGHLRFNLLLFAGLIAFGCSAKPTSDLRSGSGPPVDTAVTYVKKQGELRLTGIMNLIPVEGGCWKFTAISGKSYELVGSTLDSLHVEGATVTIRVRERPNLKSTCMVGLIAEVIGIDSIERP